MQTTWFVVFQLSSFLFSSSSFLVNTSFVEKFSGNHGTNGEALDSLTRFARKALHTMHNIAIPLRGWF